MRGNGLSRLASRYRATGADLPGGDTRPTHHAEMEGWFWRLTDPASGRVVVALCGINRHADGDWATVAVAAHPGEVVRSAAVDGATASAETFQVSVPGTLTADGSSLSVDLDDVHLRLALDDLVGWPLRLGAGGVFSAIPYLGQYWQPHVLGGRAAGELVVADERWTFAAADVYAEKNWGAGFPDWWWWGQAQGFADRDLCVAFGGGHLRAGPVGAGVTGAVVRLGERVVRFAPPVALVRGSFEDGRWRVRARTPRWRLELDGDGGGHRPTVLPVPLPAEHRNVARDFEHLAGHLRVRLWHRGQLVVDDESDLAALEVGAIDEGRAAALGASAGAAPVVGAVVA